MKIKNRIKTSQARMLLVSKVSRKQSFRTASILAVVTLTSCSSAMTKRDCQETNYYDIGYTDGKNGRTSERLQKITEECNNLGVQAAAPQYGYGRQAGLEKYCSVDNAREDAKSGKAGSLCWQEPFPAYQTAYREALTKRQRDKQDDLRDLEDSQAKDQKKNESLNSELRQIEEQRTVH